LQGSEVIKSDDEDGESDTFKYDINKIVEYPGFNVQPTGQFFDVNMNSAEIPHLFNTLLISRISSTTMCRLFKRATPRRTLSNRWVKT